MKARIYPSVLATCWRDDFKMLGVPKQVLFQHPVKKQKYTNHIGIYDLTIEEFAKLANSNNKKENL
jgi:hypothetical protein